MRHVADSARAGPGFGLTLYTLAKARTAIG